MPRQSLTRKSQKLPPILHSSLWITIFAYSKGARGLSVQLRDGRIFTTYVISLSPCWRQRGSRYTIHAGRNLPDKEFRYLRTVIVTAAVYRGLTSMRKHQSFTYRHRAGVSPYTSSCELAETCVFNKQSPPPILCQRQKLALLSLLLIPKLQSHFAEFLQQGYLKALVFSTRPPVAV